MSEVVQWTVSSPQWCGTCISLQGITSQGPWGVDNEFWRVALECGHTYGIRVKEATA